MRYFKQLWLARTWTNYTRRLILLNFKDVRVWVNIFTSKHRIPKFLLTDDDDDFEFQEFFRDKFEGFIITIKNPYARIVSYRRHFSEYKNKPFKLTNRKLVEMCEEYNTFYDNAIKLAEQYWGRLFASETLQHDAVRNWVLLEFWEKFWLQLKYDEIVNEKKIIKPSWYIQNTNKNKFDNTYYEQKKYLEYLNDGQMDIISEYIDFKNIPYSIEKKQ